MDPWEEKKIEVSQQLLLLDETQLTTVCGPLSIVVPPAKKGNRSAILSLIMRHINSELIEESNDRGLDLFEQLDTQMKGMLADRIKVEADTKKTLAQINTNTTEASSSSSGKTTPVSNSSKGVHNSGTTVGGDSTPTASGVDSTVRLHLNRLREFKIHGGFVASGENPIAYSNLKFQMEEAAELNYTEKEIMSGVIRAIKPNSYLRQYLESERNLTMEVFLVHIKNHYALQDSNTLMTTMEGSKQSANQKAQEYITQMAQLRNNIITISEEEGNPRDPIAVRKRFLHAVLVGLRRDTVRLEVQALLKAKPDISDQELGSEVQLIMAREEEHEKRHGPGAGKDVSVNSMKAEEKSAESKAVFTELSKILARVNAIESSNSAESLALKKNMQQLEKRLAVLNVGDNPEQWSTEGQVGQDGTTYFESPAHGFGYEEGYDGGNYAVKRGAYGGNRGNSYAQRGGVNMGNRGGGQVGNYGDGFSNNQAWQGGYCGDGFSNSYDGGQTGNYNDGFSGGGGFQGRGGGYNRGRGRGGGHNKNRGGGFQNRGGGNGNRGGGNGGNQGGNDGSRGGRNGSNRGGNNQNRGGFNNNYRGGFNGNRGGSNRGGYSNRPFNLKCEECIKTDAYCQHCTICGESDHKWASCPKNH